MVKKTNGKKEIFLNGRYDILYLNCSRYLLLFFTIFCKFFVFFVFDLMMQLFQRTKSSNQCKDDMEDDFVAAINTTTTTTSLLLHIKQQHCVAK